MDNISKDQETRKVEAEIKKLESEAKKYEQEAAASRSSRIRGWITVVSVSAGIIVSAVGIYESLTNIAYKNRQLGMEAQVRSHDIYLNILFHFGKYLQSRHPIQERHQSGVVPYFVLIL